jgi:signal transduction histidine kinase
VQQEKKTLAEYQTFISRISYDISNPIYILMSINDMFIDGNTSSQSLETIKKLSVQSKDNLNHVLNGLLEYIELTSKQKNVALQPSSLHSMIATQLYLEAEQVKLKNIIIHKKYNIEAVALCIPHQIESVITYFTQNAINNTNQGGEIDVRLYVENNDIHFEVEDSCPKLPIAELTNLFKDNETKPSLKPTRDEKSLDLTLCREVIQNHGGEIGVRYGDRGNIYFFKLPSDQSLQSDVKH